MAAKYADTLAPGKLPQEFILLLFPFGEYILVAYQSAKEDTMLCTIIDIRGDYAYVKYLETGVVSEVAIALLPFGVDVGDKLKFEDFEFTQV